MLDESPAMVYVYCLTSDGADCGVVFQKCDLLFQPPGFRDIVVVHEGDKRGAGVCDGGISGGGGSAVFFTADNPDSGIFCGDVGGAAGSLRIVGAVVHNDEFQVAEGLCEDAFRRLDKIFRAVVDGQNDGNGGRDGHGRII